MLSNVVGTQETALRIQYLAPFGPESMEYSTMRAKKECLSRCRPIWHNPARPSAHVVAPLFPAGHEGALQASDMAPPLFGFDGLANLHHLFLNLFRRISIVQWSWRIEAYIAAASPRLEICGDRTWMWSACATFPGTDFIQA